jgi:A/G-specific adenine glycosylase
MSFSPGTRKYFTEQLLKWHFEENDRELPWKNEQDPYKIWLSEIILQQTRAEQGRPYYERFIEHYPDVHSLANAPEDEVFRLWQGLGYYNRCRNLLAAARTISDQYQGRFPDTYEDIISLKGVGEYTAAAIASFAYNLPHAVLDGNVYRVLARYFGIDSPTDTPSAKKMFQQLADQLLDQAQPAAFNQAIMDFGSSVCKPRLPLCTTCPLQRKCVAYQKDMVELLPLKKKKLEIKQRQLHYFVLLAGDEVYIQQRTQKDIWQSLYEFLLIETADKYEMNTIWQSLLPHIEQCAENEFSSRQKLTHQLITSTFHIITVSSKPDYLKQGIWVKRNSLKNYAFPRTILSFLNRKKYF